MSNPIGKTDKWTGFFKAFVDGDSGWKWAQWAFGDEHDVPISVPASQIHMQWHFCSAKCFRKIVVSAFRFHHIPNLWKMHLGQICFEEIHFRKILFEKMHFGKIVLSKYRLEQTVWTNTVWKKNCLKTLQELLMLMSIGCDACWTCLR